MDMSMPRMNGAEAAGIIRREVPESKIIIVTQNDPDLMRRQVSEIGARGFARRKNAISISPTSLFAGRRVKSRAFSFTAWRSRRKSPLAARSRKARSACDWRRTPLPWGRGSCTHTPEYVNFFPSFLKSLEAIRMILNMPTSGTCEFIPKTCSGLATSWR